MTVRSFDINNDLNGIRDCFVELQDFERDFDPRMPAGIEIVDIYIPRMLHRCRQCKGKVLVAEFDGQVAGYATVLPKVKSDEVGDGDIAYALISDLVVSSRFRKMGLGRSLLVAAESYARSCAAKSLRIGAMAANEAARALYESAEFKNIYVELEKVLAE